MVRDKNGDWIEVSGGLTRADLTQWQTLNEYISNKSDNSQRAFADAQGVKPPQVTQWLNKGFIVVDDVLYSPRRELNK